MHQPGAQTVIGKSYPDAGVEQGRAVLRGAGAASRDREARRHQARAPFRRRRAAACAGRAAGQALPRHRRRSERSGEGAGDRARSLGRAARQAQASGRMDHRGAARRRRHSRPISGRSCRRTTCWASRCGGRRLPTASPTRRALARRPRAAPRHRQSTGAARRRAAADPREVFEETLAPHRLGRNAADHHARREPPAGARAPVHGAQSFQR